MTLRQMTEDFDYTVGRPPLVNIPQIVADLLYARLQMWRGEWFLDTALGLDYTTLLGSKDKDAADTAVRIVILGTRGVTEIISYESTVDTERRFRLDCEVGTMYGVTKVVL